MPFCTQCGNNLQNDRFCPQCGAPADADVTSVRPPAAPEPETSVRPVVEEPETSVRPVTSEPTTSVRPVELEEATIVRSAAPVESVEPPAPYLPPPPSAYPAASAYSAASAQQPFYAPPPLAPPAARWTPGKVFVALGFLLGIGAIGFLLTYFFNPLAKDDDTIPPPLPQLASSSSQTFDGAPDPTTDEGEAFAQLTRIAAQDRAALQSSQQWRAQLASSPATESATQFLASYQETMRSMPNSLLAWSGDWPQSYGPSSRSSWVILSDFTKPTTAPVISWCADKNLGCWAKRLSDFGTPDDNTDHPPADPGKN